MKLKKYLNFDFLKKMGPEKWIILAAAAILVIIMFIPSEKKKDDKTQVVQESEIQTVSYQDELEERLTDILSGIEGAGKVKVMITLDGSEEIVLQTDSSLESDITNETDSDGGQRSVNNKSYSYTTVLTGGSADGKPYVIRQIYPKISGVVVIAEGAGSAGIQNQISEAVQALFDIPAHKIKVLKAS